ncbi:peroxidase-related enzyme [Candidatus Bathyarchaeota archaeon]|nr:peroxidase-related enzyme [Candidatus Bathyarchaeota archaeon]
MTLAWIKTISEDKATGDLKRTYEEVLRSRGKISNIMRVQSLNPNALKAFLELYVNLMYGKSGLSRSEREMIATAISAHNRCDYCVSHHGEALRFYVKDGDQLEAFKRGQLPEKTEMRTKALIDYALRLTVEPSSVVNGDLEALHRVGLNDSEILDLVLLTAYMNYVNRVAKGLGVEHNEQEARGYKY